MSVLAVFCLIFVAIPTITGVWGVFANAKESVFAKDVEKQLKITKKAKRVIETFEMVLQIISFLGGVTFVCSCDGSLSFQATSNEYGVIGSLICYCIVGYIGYLLIWGFVFLSSLLFCNFLTRKTKKLDSASEYAFEFSAFSSTINILMIVAIAMCCN